MLFALCHQRSAWNASVQPSPTKRLISVTVFHPIYQPLSPTLDYSSCLILIYC